MRVAVVGSGVGGLSAAWALHQCEADVQIYEEAAAPGGHANTAYVQSTGKHPSVAVDTAFVLINRHAYPNFTRFLNAINVDVEPSSSSFGVSDEYDDIEWSSTSFSSFFAKPESMLNPQMWRMLYDMTRFYACARKILQDPSFPFNVTIGEYLDTHGYSAAFRNWYLLPLAAGTWVIPPEACAARFPIRVLVQFMHNHRLLRSFGDGEWLTIKGGSKVYVDKVIDIIGRERLHTGVRVTKVKTLPSQKIEVSFADGRSELFDKVIMACHSNTAMEILEAGNMTSNERRVLEKFSWSSSDAVLHSDAELMPKQFSTWSSWNCLTACSLTSNREMSASMWLNKLQHISRRKYGDLFVTLNPSSEPRHDRVLSRFRWCHPIVDSASVKAQKEMPSIQNQRGIVFAGAYLGYGFHEDGFISGINAAAQIIGEKRQLPFQLVSPDQNVTFEWQWVFFEIFESLGLRTFTGYIFSVFLQCLRLVFALVSSDKS